MKLNEDIDEHNFVKKCREVGQKYGVKIEVLAPTETTGKNTWVINIVSGKLDFVSNFVDTALRTKVASADIIEIANSKEWVTVHNKNYPQQFSGEPLKCVSELMKIGKQYVVAPNQLKVYIGGRMKRYSYLGPKKKITEDVKQLIQNPILKVFDQFGKQYLAQVLDASLNKMIQVAAKRGAKVTVQQLIAQIQQNPNGDTAKTLFKAMATVIKQVSAQIPTIVTTNVSSINESVGGWKGKAPEEWINSALLGLSMKYERLENEKMHLAKAKTKKEKELRAVWVKQIEKEISKDKDHIRKLGGDPDVASDMSVDELAADLEDFDIK